MGGRKYHSAVVAIARDENPYLLEWAAYHLAIGFEHVFVYDNMSREPLADLFSVEGAHRYVTVTRWPTLPDQSPQIKAYEHYLWSHGRDVDWTAVFDLDELLNLKRHDTIADFLAGFDAATGVAINWRFFGSSGETRHRSGLMMERFTRAAPIDFPKNATVKSIHRTKHVSRLMHHYSGYLVPEDVRSPDGSRVANGPTIAPTESNLAAAQVNHYFVKSREEWDRKMNRGYNWKTVDKRDMLALNDRNECEDASILKWKAETERWMSIIGRSQGEALRTRLSGHRFRKAYRWAARKAGLR